MTSDDFRSALDRLGDGWATRDYKTVASHFGERLHYSDAINYCFRDKKSLVEFFEDDDGKPQSCKFHNAIFDESRQLGCAEYSYKGNFIYHGTVWIKVVDDKIVEWREYQHRSEKTWKEFWKDE
ncbi:MAG: hypothetical protein JSS77_10155 [Acidobacteria bacterium]|nr:hypothetical protein [Acidobacteriota bacterium]